MSSMTYQDVLWLLDTIDASDGIDVDLKVDGFEVSLNWANVQPRSGTVPSALGKAPARPAAKGAQSAPTQATISGSSAPKTASAATANDVVSPMGGMFYASPAPGKPAFVSVGQTVSAGEQVGIIEVMKLFTPVTVPHAGTIQAIHVEDQQTVAKDELLISIEPGEGA